ncbi:Inclusion body clearance protein IML2 [Nakaseomyces bracarensis]|uniref:Inclusion body clearance protein IML2 n=1 Tax=Nakaseomyces bracarensis TaxID=273131 RepID=A0ABR4P0I6_9SACH
MFSFFGGGSAPELSQEEKTKLVLKQAYDFEIALRAMDYVLDDNAERGLKLLEDSDKEADEDERTINVLARGVIEFLEATLSFEAEEMKKASATLAKAETLSQKSKTNAENLKLSNSSRYPPGTVFAVTYTESLLLHALLMIFSESMMEVAKALLKLRKAYYTLQEVLQQIKDANLKAVEEAERRGENLSAGSSAASFIGEGEVFNSVDIPYKLSEEEAKDKDLLEFAEKVHRMRMKRLSGAHIDNPPAINRLRDELGLQAMDKLPKEPIEDHVVLSDDIDKSQATIDEFIHSGVNLCFGILQVVLSLLPPAIGAVLSVVGFSGSREEGLKLVWKATKHRNVHGCIGLLGLMFYYDGPFQFTDDDFDVPASVKEYLESQKKKEITDNKEGDEDKEVSREPSITAQSVATVDSLNMDSNTLLHPGKIMEDALLKSRALFPNSALWLLNEARMLSGKGRLEDAVALMDSIDVNKIRMRQVKSLMIFDRAITLIHLHEYDRAADDILSLLDISDWSHAFYSYFAGCCYLENWRMIQMGDLKSDKEEFYKEQASKLIFKSVDYLGKKTWRSKNLPLDRFVARKVEQFKATQAKLNLTNPLDAIATSPVYEIAYFYNGFNRMSKKHLEISQKMLTEYKNPAIESNDPNQNLIRDLLLSLSLRRLDKIEEGCKLLDEKVLPVFFSVTADNHVSYVKKSEDPWLYPSAFYERALFCWKLNGVEKLPECKEWLIRAQNYADDYELSSRVGMKIKAAIDRVDSALNN